MALPIYTHIPNLEGLTKIFFKLSRPKENLYGGGVTVLNPKYPRLSSGDTIISRRDHYSSHFTGKPNTHKISRAGNYEKKKSAFCMGQVKKTNLFKTCLL